MATNIYEPCTNPVTGETFKALSVDDDAYVMQWIVQPKGHVPFEHIHLYQDEIFHIKKGELKIRMNGKIHIHKEGETITVPKGTPHIAFNNSDKILECIVEYRPRLDSDIMMQCFMGLTRDRYIDKNGSIDLPKMGYFLVKMKAKCMTRPTSIPAYMLKLALMFFYIRGSLSGWKKHYKKYTGKM